MERGDIKHAPALENHELATATLATRANERNVFAILMARFLCSLDRSFGMLLMAVFGD
jgi:hypothetical protein